MNIVLFSTYELGHQPASLAFPAAILKAGGANVRAIDLSLERYDHVNLEQVHLVAFSIPMHTAARLTVDPLLKTRRKYPEMHIAAYGLYAVMNREFFIEIGVNSVFGPEAGHGLLALSETLAAGAKSEAAENRDKQSSGEFVVPDRGDLPGLERYAHIQLADGGRRIAGHTDASVGCKHHCRHCPVVPVYQGRFRAVPRDVVLADIRQQVSAGAEHISFGDPDFLNGPTHGRRIVEALHHEFSDLTYDVTVKVEHLLSNPGLIAVLKNTGCLFVTTAVESVDDYVLQQLAKGHTRQDFFRLLAVLDESGLGIVPTFIPFTPWTTLEDYIELLQVVAESGLIESVAPVQLTIRLLIPPASKLLDLDEIQSRILPLQADAFMYPWQSLDPRVDQLQQALQKLIQSCSADRRSDVFYRIWEMAHHAAGRKARAVKAGVQRKAPAQHSEPWYCCAEPTQAQYHFV